VGGQSVRNVIDGTLAVPATFRHHYIAEKAVALMDGKGILAERSEAVGVMLDRRPFKNI
jgi:hypothetical protein